jgi:hypothetical protein
MALKDDLKITNPNAPFIELQKLLKNTPIPKSKYGDIKFIDKAVEYLDIDEDIRNEIFKLVDDLMFRKPVK